ncbi:hypothetical protein [Coralloluteibacterium thermophilus]|uniref:Plasmid stabilization protein n=1 Tax=Coralloluteibacterium thermophilum TaxID=2707049 RepID=A0ABV9NJA4_9GAMM
MAHVITLRNHPIERAHHAAIAERDRALKRGLPESTARSIETRMRNLVRAGKTVAEARAALRGYICDAPSPDGAA